MLANGSNKSNQLVGQGLWGTRYLNVLGCWIEAERPEGGPELLRGQATVVINVKLPRPGHVLELLQPGCGGSSTKLCTICSYYIQGQQRKFS